GWSDGLAKATGDGMKTLGRATPTIVNAAFNPVQFWDGRKPSLEEQALGPLTAAAEMHGSIADMKRKLEAIASFERTVLSTDSPFDRWMRGDQHAMSEAAKRGFEVFRGPGNCETCHSG